MNIRINLAATLTAGGLLLLSSAEGTQAAPTTEIQYVCAASQRLVVRKSGDSAWVSFVGRSYELRQKPSSIGEKFISPKAALIIDGASAVFVDQDRPQLGQCVEASRTTFQH